MVLEDQEINIKEENRMRVEPLIFNSVEERIRYARDTFPCCIGEELTEYMINNGFCSAPASTKYHGNYEGGLFDHSLAVASKLIDFTNALELKWEKPTSPFTVGILHDLCKIDNYKRVEDSYEEGEIHYEYDNSPIVKGHGTKSVIYALMLGGTLTKEEVACILYHRGAFEHDSASDYANAVERYPNVLFTQTADMYASRVWRV